MTQIDFIAEAHALRDELVARRRDLHQHPEIAFEEVRTANIVAEELMHLGLEVQREIGKTGVVAVLEGESDGPTVLVRADMDALPMHEENDVPYKSLEAGKMHACGHDGHTSIALGVAKLLSRHRAQINGRVKFVFQPAEEIGAGAAAMIEDNVLGDPKPDVALGLHLWNELPIGTVGISEGPIMASPGRFEIEIKGKGGHGGQPHLTHDPIICAAQIAMALQTIVSRSADPFETAVVSITKITAGASYNIIPDSAHVAGTFRIFTHQMRDLVMTQIEQIAKNTGAALGCEVRVEKSSLCEPVNNDPTVAHRLSASFANLVGAQNLVTERTMAAEDMARFLEAVPGAFFFVGSRNDRLGLTYGHHHPRFDFDEDALPLGVALLATAVTDYVMTS